MYEGVPKTSPVMVSRSSSPDAKRATPKSSSFTRSSRSTKMFDGFRSRCTTPARCAASSASTMLMRIDTKRRKRQALARVAGDVDAGAQLHRQIRPTVGQRVLVGDFDHVRVAHAIGQPRFPREALVHARVAQVVGVQHLERDAPAEQLMLGQEHLAHAARAQLLQQHERARVIARLQLLAAMERDDARVERAHGRSASSRGSNRRSARTLTLAR